MAEDTQPSEDNLSSEESQPTEQIPVSIVYALPQEQWLLELDVPVGTRVEDLLAQVAHREPFNTLDLNAAALGIYGETVLRERRLQAHDRLEIYRPLLADPKTARRQRAAASGAADAGK